MSVFSPVLVSNMFLNVDTTGLALVPVFSRRTTHLLCPSGVGAKADKARELGIPIVDMDWLASIANTGKIPTAEVPSSQADLDLDLQLQSQRPRSAEQGQDSDLWMASQPPATIPPKADAKGKAKAMDTMIDITNAHAENALPRSQSLSYFDPAVDEPRPGQADQMETFGLPALLLSGSQPALSPRPPATPRRPGRTPDPDDAALPTTQPVEEEGESVSIPSRMYEDRIPSSESPSPMRMPGMPTPQDSAPAPRTPTKPTKQATVVLQTRLTTLLGKRTKGDDDDAEAEREKEEALSAKKLKAQNSRLGKRLKPLQRTTVRRPPPFLSPSPLTCSSRGARQSNVSCTSLLGTPGQSPASAFAAAASPIAPPEPELLPQLPSAKRPRPASSSGDEAESNGSYVGAETNESLRVAYADPHQNGELDRLKYLFNPEDGGQRREGWEMELGLDVEKEMTLPQLTEASVASTRSRRGRTTGRGRRGRGKKAARA